MYRHPLAALRAGLGVSATGYLRLVNTRHRQLGFGSMATRAEKVCRWESGTAEPERSAQLAMAALHDVAPSEVEDRGWPNWLLAAFPDDTYVQHLPWSAEGNHAALMASVEGGPVDRRAFLTVTGTALSAVTAQWARTLDLPLPTSTHAGRHRLTPATLTRLEARLDDLRHLDDVLGGRELLHTATSELNLLAGLAQNATYDEMTGRRLHRAIAEAGRICGWVHYDAGLHAAAQGYYIAALRTSTTANDSVTGAHIMAFLAIQAFTVGDPRDALQLVETACDTTAGTATPRVQALLHTLAARAHAKLPDGSRGYDRAIGRAQDAYDAGHRDADPTWAYWVDGVEIASTAAACELDLGRPGQALAHFAQVRAARSRTSADFARDTALDLLDEARAHLALGDVDTACRTARTALDHAAGVDSGRVAVHLSSFRDRVAARASASGPAREFLEATA